MVWPCEHEELTSIANRTPVKNERACRVGERVVKPDRGRINLVVLVEESLMAGLGKHHETEDPSEWPLSADGASVG